MIEGLRQHIRDSLMEIPDDLPELKGIRAKLPDAYKGEDNFDRLDNWLQGLLRHFKLHHLTGADRDADRVLVSGTCLTGKAERWFSHEVERLMRIICNWTFESVIVGLYTAFITTATAQQAMLCYTQIRFSHEEGVTAFHRKLMLWAGRLAQYPDEYSFRRRLFGGLLMEHRQHLTLYDGISAEHSSIDDIMLKAQCLEKTLISMRSGRGFERQSVQSPAIPAVANPQRGVTSRNKWRMHTVLPRQLQIRSNADTRAQAQ
jgi:hypothetical protein